MPVRHILSNCKLALNRYTWRHNQVLAVLAKVLKDKISQFNDGMVPRKDICKKVTFHKAGARNQCIAEKKSQTSDQRWSGKWEIAADLDNVLVFPLIMTTQRPDLVVWSEETKTGIVLELTVPWEQNFEDAEHRKATRYEKLIEDCRASGWQMDYHHLAVGARGYLGRKLLNILKHRFCFTPTELRRIANDIQHVVEKASF